MLEGQNIFLRLMEIEDVAFKVNWVNDDDVRKSLVFFDYPISKIGTEQWLRKSASDPSRKDFFICLKSNNNPIGFAGLSHIDYKSMKAESYLCVGAKEHWGKGYGYEVKKILLQYAFDELQLNKIYSYHLADNHPMININMKLGGRIEGTLREDVFFNGKHCDRVLVSVLKKEMIK